jgi:putative transposase
MAPANKFSAEERAKVLQVVNSKEYCDLSPRQIVPKLADKKEYIGSESTIYRILHTEKMMQPRRAERPQTHKKPLALSATKPNQLWSWDITYLLSPIRGQYFFLYLFMDIFSRKIVGYDTFLDQSADLASTVVSKAYIAEKVAAHQVTLHSDNGGPMKGSMMLATLEMLGVAASFSRPSVSNDNPFSESLFKTCKYRPNYPSNPFESLEAAVTWVASFVHWYNEIHQHSAISFVTPSERHDGKDTAILEARKVVWQAAKQKNPDRWSKGIRNWDRINEVFLNKKRMHSQPA